ncbi:MAG: rhodanese-like domain-containing protein, partial [Rhodospirillaceae bacterium]|nr:rhodanese-like domain-containing protein [Rhodospirillaceae bacterium]
MARLVEFAQNNLFLVLALLATWSAVMFYEIKLKSRGLFQVSSADALRIINKGAMIIDVRPAEAYGNGHIVNARNIALEALESDRPPLKRKSKVLLTVCE